MDNNSLLIYGRHPIKEALKTKRIKICYISESFSDKELVSALKKAGIDIVFQNNKELDNLTNNANHQGIVALIKRYEYYSFESILEAAKKESNPLIILLDEIYDPHNLGAIIRSCDAFGVCGIIVKKRNQAKLDSTIAKTSAGAINYVKVAQVPNLVNAIKKLQENGFWVVSTSGEAKTNCYDLAYDFPCVLVIGNEGGGISRLVLENSDYIVKIPMKGQVNSLNASVAAAVMMSVIRNKQ